jgi:hypothetical protein
MLSARPMADTDVFPTNAIVRIPYVLNKAIALNFGYRLETDLPANEFPGRGYAPAFGDVDNDSIGAYGTLGDLIFSHIMMGR